MPLSVIRFFNNTAVGYSTSHVLSSHFYHKRSA